MSEPSQDTSSTVRRQEAAAASERQSISSSSADILSPAHSPSASVHAFSAGQPDLEMQQVHKIVSKKLEDKLSDAHYNRLTGKKLITVFLGMSALIFFSFADQSGITILLPEIAASLNAERTISWARHR